MLPALSEDLVEEIILRFPPDDPACLLGAALVCKDWCRVICGPGFRSRFREFHRNPPLVGIIYWGEEASTSHGVWIVKTNFMPLSTTFTLPSAKLSRRDAIDTLHSRILFWDREDMQRPSAWMEFVVWSPIPSLVLRLPLLLLGKRRYAWTAALLCATASCNHLDCGSGAFLVIFAGTNPATGLTSVYIYSSEQNVWSEPISIQDQDRSVHGIIRPSARVGNTVYFVCEASNKLLAFEMGNQQLSFVSIPSTCRNCSFTVFAIAEDKGKLGYAVTQDSKLFTWSRDAGRLDGDAGWTQRRVFELDKLIPSCIRSFVDELYATTNNRGVVIVKGRHVLFTLDLKSGKVTKLVDGCTKHIYDVVLYMGFCTPSLPPNSKLASGHGMQQQSLYL
ncbi:hypothetical protein EJB05_13825, partial [Eragrostis curvula]